MAAKAPPAAGRDGTGSAGAHGRALLPGGQALTDEHDVGVVAAATGGAHTLGEAGPRVVPAEALGGTAIEPVTTSPDRASAQGSSAISG
jgi:hypothetical protein